MKTLEKLLEATRTKVDVQLAHSNTDGKNRIVFKTGKISPAVKVDKIIEDIENNIINIETAAEMVVSIYNNAIANSDKVNIDFISDKEKVLDKIELAIYPSTKDYSLVPHFEILDLTCVFKIVVDDMNDEFRGTIMVTNELMKSLNLSFEELKEAAITNTKDTYTIMAMGEMFGEILEENIDLEPKLYVISNRINSNGATCLCHTHVLDKACDTMNGDIYILPSSIHEVIAVPATFVSDVNELKNMVQSVNDNEVAPEEVLSYNVYKYSKATKRLEIA